jgi:hypothetical protein
MPTEKTIKISANAHKRLLQYKINNDHKTIDAAIQELLNEANRA